MRRAPAPDRSRRPTGPRTASAAGRTCSGPGCPPARAPCPRWCRPPCHLPACGTPRSPTARRCGARESADVVVAYHNDNGGVVVAAQMTPQHPVTLAIVCNVLADALQADGRLAGNLHRAPLLISRAENLPHADAESDSVRPGSSARSHVQLHLAVKLCSLPHLHRSTAWGVHFRIEFARPVCRQPLFMRCLVSSRLRKSTGTTVTRHCSASPDYRHDDVIAAGLARPQAS